MEKSDQKNLKKRVAVSLRSYHKELAGFVTVLEKAKNIEEEILAISNILSAETKIGYLLKYRCNKIEEKLSVRYRKQVWRGRIVKCSKSSAWYFDKIGEILIVKRCSSNPDCFKIVEPQMWSFYLVNRQDFKITKELPHYNDG